jgi:hypothetical protein
VLDVGGVSVRSPAYPPEARVAGEEEALGLVDEDAGGRGRRQGEPVVGADGDDPQEDAEADGHGAREQHAPLEHDLLVDGLHAALHARRTPSRVPLGLGVLGHGFSCTAAKRHPRGCRAINKPASAPAAVRATIACAPAARSLAASAKPRPTDRPRAARSRFPRALPASLCPLAPWGAPRH